MTLAPPPGPARPTRPRRLLGDLAGAFARRRGPVPDGCGPLDVAPGSAARHDTGRHDAARHGAGDGAVDGPGAGWWDLVHGTTDRVTPLTRPVTGGEVPGSADLAGVDGWLTARAGSGGASPDRALDRAPGGSSGVTSGVVGPVVGQGTGPATVPVRVPAWPAWAASPGPGAGTVPAPRPVEVTGTTAAPSVVRVSSARPAPVRAPLRPTGPGAAVPAPAVPADRADTGRVGPDRAGPPAGGVGTAAAVEPVGSVPAGTAVALLLGGGRRVPLTTTLLVGRNPAPRSGETVGGLVAVDDPARSVSKTHLTVGVDDGGPWVVDRHSTNGTVVTLPDGQRILCVPERRVRLAVGASVHFGDHGFTLTAAADPERPLSPAQEDDR